MSNKQAHVILSEIQRQLWSGHASVMIGSGFSRNADRASSTIPYPPDWNTLAKKFVDRLYPDSTDEEKTAVLGKKGVLQLAQEFEAAFQRTALNRYVKELICDENLIPNKLFSRLLELPWNEVFTTNYDTLLERAARTVLTQKYDVVYSCKDLAFSDSPRIIKLHGSFPTDATPLILTEEDYRTYPVKYSPFVNTVQQTLMENVLCLIGFSGTDPNFLKWIGWVRDNLGDSMPSIYLIGFMELTNAERRVLESKRIIPVDLSELTSGDESGYLNAFDAAFKILETRPAFIEWNPINTFDLPQKRQEEIIAAIKKLEQNRLSYPNWIVMPWKHQEKMFISTELATRNLSYVESLPSPWDIKGLYELNWRMERCLLPIRNELIETYQRILRKYDASISSGEYGHELKGIWRELLFALYRWCREESQVQTRMQLESVLESVSDDVESLNQLRQEHVMWALTLPDVQLLDDALEKWDKTPRPPLWDIRYAAFLCETGSVERAVQIYETVLSTIRPNIPKGKIKNDFFLLSLEGIILTALSDARASIHLRKHNQIERESWLEYHHRLEELATMGCDPRVLMSHFEMLMSAPQEMEVGEFKSRAFDMVTRSWKMKYGWPKDCRVGYQFARFIEDVSIPLYIGHVNTGLTSSTPGCVLRLADHSPAWAFSLFARIGPSEKASAEVFISQRKEYLLPNEQVDAIIEQYSKQIRYLLEQCSDQLKTNSTSVHRRMAMVMFEVISRLTAKASQKSLSTLLELGAYIEKTALADYDLVFKDIHIFYRRVITAMSSDLLFQHLELLLTIGVPPQKYYWRSWQNPLVSVEWCGLRKSLKDCSETAVSLMNANIQTLLSDNIFERTAALLSLRMCMDLGIATEEQRRQIAQNLSAHVGPDGLPLVNRFYKHAFLSLLEPIAPREVVVNAIKKSLLGFDFVALTDADVKNNNCNSIPRIENYAYSILSTSSTIHSLPENHIELSSRECQKLFENLQVGFEASLERAKSAPLVEWTFSSGLKQRMKHELFFYDRILGEVIVPRLRKNSRAKVMQWICKFEEKCSFLCARVALELYSEKDGEELALDVSTSFAAEDVDVIKSGFRAFYNWCCIAKAKRLSMPFEVLRDAVNVVAMRDGDAFFSACENLGKLIHLVPFPEDLEQSLLVQLDKLAEATTYDSSSARFDNDYRGDYRAWAANLANQIYTEFLSKKRSLPQTILKWKAICKSSSELVSVRRMWNEPHQTGRTLSNPSEASTGSAPCDTIRVTQ